jgi:hypothetical protein
MERHDDKESRDSHGGVSRRALLGAAAAAGVLAASAPAARAGAIARRAAGSADVAADPDVPVCPSGSVCLFSGANGTGSYVSFTTASYHSQWYDFDSVPGGFHPNSIINNSGSDIWVYDLENAQAGGTTATLAGPFPAFGAGQTVYNFSTWLPVNPGASDQGYTPAAYQPGWFFVNYNVNTCATPPSTLPT